MKRIGKSIVICLLLSLIFIYNTHEAGAVKVSVENLTTCEFDVFLWYQKDGSLVRMGPVYLTHGQSYTFDTGRNLNDRLAGRNKQ